jgi:hypothetical protein
MKCQKCGDECVPGDGDWCTYCKEFYDRPCPSCKEHEATIKAWQLRFLDEERKHAAALAQKDKVIEEMKVLLVMACYNCRRKRADRCFKTCKVKQFFTRRVEGKTK